MTIGGIAGAETGPKSGFYKVVEPGTVEFAAVRLTDSLSSLVELYSGFRQQGDILRASKQTSWTVG